MSEPRPIFLIGAARSGTKYLRDLLAADPAISATAYDMNYVWRHGNESWPDDAIDPSQVDDRIARHIRKEILRLSTSSSGEVADLLVEKTVSNTLRVPMVRRVFPEARFIYLERGGYDVVESAYRQWTGQTDRSYLLNKVRHFPLREWRYALWFMRNSLQRNVPSTWGPRYPGIEDDLARMPIEEVCARQWRSCVLAAREAIDPTDTYVIRYESLGDTQALGHLLDWLGVDPAPVIKRASDTYSMQSTWPGAISDSSHASVAEIIDIVPAMDESRFEAKKSST